MAAGCLASSSIAQDLQFYDLALKQCFCHLMFSPGYNLWPKEKHSSYCRVLSFVWSGLVCITHRHLDIRGQTIKFANLPPCACRGSTGQKP